VIGALRRNFLTGLVTLAPLAVTVWVVWRFYLFISATIRPWVRRVPTLHEAYPEFFLNILGLLVMMVLITLVGIFTRNLIGIAFFRLVERVVQRIPVVKGMYSGLKQIGEVLLQDRRTAFQQAAIFQYPRPGVWSLGFVTRDGEGDEPVTIFLPTTPNPTSGFMLLMPREEIRVLDMPVEEAIKLVVSGGSIMTSEQAKAIGGLSAELAAPDDLTGKDGAT